MLQGLKAVPKVESGNISELTAASPGSTDLGGGCGGRVHSDTCPSFPPGHTGPWLFTHRLLRGHTTSPSRRTPINLASPPPRDAQRTAGWPEPTGSHGARPPEGPWAGTQ